MAHHTGKQHFEKHSLHDELRHALGAAAQKRLSRRYLPSLFTLNQHACCKGRAVNSAQLASQHRGAAVWHRRRKRRCRNHQDSILNLCKCLEGCRTTTEPWRSKCTRPQLQHAICQQPCQCPPKLTHHMPCHVPGKHQCSHALPGQGPTPPP